MHAFINVTSFLVQGERGPQGPIGPSGPPGASVSFHIAYHVSCVSPITLSRSFRLVTPASLKEIRRRFVAGGTGNSLSVSKPKFMIIFLVYLFYLFLFHNHLSFDASKL